MRKEYPLRPKKRLGQHFLKDQRIIREILTRAAFDASCEVLEIGSGLGALTLPLARAGYHVTAVEKDSSLAQELSEKLSLAGLTNVTLLNEDILKLDLDKVLSPTGGRIQVIGNLPYNISSPVLEKLIKNRRHIGKAVLTFQAEFARRLAAEPGNKDYGAMTLLVKYHAQILPLLTIHKEAFFPRPKIDSMVLALDFSRPYPKRAYDDELFRRVVKGAFAHRRKTIINSLRGAFPSLQPKVIQEALEESGIAPGKRAEVLGMDDFLRLCEAMSKSLTLSSIGPWEPDPLGQRTHQGGCENGSQRED